MICDLFVTHLSDLCLTCDLFVGDKVLGMDEATVRRRSRRSGSTRIEHAEHNGMRKTKNRILVGRRPWTAQQYMQMATLHPKLSASRISSSFWIGWRHGLSRGAIFSRVNSRTLTKEVNEARTGSTALEKTTQGNFI